MSEVKRYDYGYVDDGNGGRYLGLIEKLEGKLVRHDDYAALKAERDVLDALCQERFDELAALNAPAAETNDYLMVPRELLDRMQKHVSNFEAQDELRALLEAPAVDVCQTMQRPKAECGCPDCGSSLIDWPSPAVAGDERAMQLLADLSSTPQDGEKVSRQRLAAISEVGHDRAAFIARLTRPAQTEQQPVAWQFYQDGKWWNGDDRIKDHRKNTVEAGFPVRDVFAAPIAQTPACPTCHGVEVVATTDKDHNGDTIERRCPSCQTPADGPNYKLKFENLVEHAKRQDKVIADMRYDEKIRRYYDTGEVWFWAGDGTDNLDTLACPVVINAGDLRALIDGRSADGLVEALIELRDAMRHYYPYPEINPPAHEAIMARVDAALAAHRAGGAS